MSDDKKSKFAVLYAVIGFVPTLIVGVIYAAILIAQIAYYFAKRCMQDAALSLANPIGWLEDVANEARRKAL